jgi:hypothetical protein
MEVRMLARFRKDPLIGNILGLVALFIALGAGAYAAGLTRNSVKSKHIVNEQVKEQDLAAEAVDSSRIAPGAIQSELVPDDELVGGDIDESTLGSVPNAANSADAGLLDGQDSSAFQQVGSEGWTALPLNNFGPDLCHWATFPGGFADPSYFRDRDGIVHLRGVAEAIDGTNFTCGAVPGLDEVIGTLPSGYLPQIRALFTVSSNNKPGRVDILPNTGQVKAEVGYPTTADMEAWVSLDGISFRCGPSGANGCP